MKTGLRLLCVAAIALGAQSAANAAFDVRVNDVTAVPGGSATLTVSVSGGLQFTSFNVAFGVDPMAGNAGAGNAPLASTAVEGIGSVWDTALGLPSISSVTSSPNPANPLPNTDSVINTAIDGEIAIADGTAILATFSVPATAQVGDMYVVDINERGFTSAGLSTGGVFTDLCSMLMFFPNGNGLGNGIGKITVVPEPSSFILLGLIGGVGVAGNWIRKRFQA